MAPETTLTVEAVRFEHRRVGDALGIDQPRPRLSWIARTDAPDWRQAAYEIELDGQPCGRVAAAASVLVPWPGEPLASRRRVAVRVRVWGEDGSASPWCEPAAVEAGLLAPEDWTARFVTPADPGAAGGPQPLLRHAFELAEPIAHARLYVTALGCYELELNGQRVGDHLLEPGWTSYDHHLRVETHDVTALLRPGANALGALLGDGWFRGVVGYAQKRNLYGERLALLAQLEVTRPDGTTEVVASDASWQSALGPLLSSDTQEGEAYDARLERAGWSSPGHVSEGWTDVELLDRDLTTLVARTGPPVRATETLAPVAIQRSPSGKLLVDFGQNLVGHVRITVNGPAGTTITLRHAEVLKDGELHTAPLGTAYQTDRYTLAGGGSETWEPRFTFHGFRYAELDGWPGELSSDDIVAVVCHSDMQRSGWFECSDERVNRLHENVVWSMRGNFVDIPTDCPQRSERLGWTGDIALFGPTACFLYDSAGLLESWLADLAAEQRADGTVSFVVPDIFQNAGSACAVWGDVAVLLPWALYEGFGDVELLRTQYSSMRAYVERVAELAGPGRLRHDGKQFGDWCDPVAPVEDEAAGATDRHLLANAWYIHAYDLMADIAELLGETQDAARYRTLAAETRTAFAAEYVTPSGRIMCDSQAAYASALRFDLLPSAAQREHAGARLAAIVQQADHAIATGFVGTQIICDALCATGNAADAYGMLLREQMPSWLYPIVAHGATTIWEAWNVILPDGRLNPADDPSQNHYAFGAVADWLHRSVAGLAPAEPGYRRIQIRPLPGGGLTSAAARHDTPYGSAASAWRIEGEEIEVTATVPPNTTATVTLPGADGEPIEVGSGTHRWRYAFAPGPTSNA